MDSADIFRHEDSFHFIKPDDFDSLGIDPADIPVGTFPSLKHPSMLPSRFGGNAYGLGMFELYDRLGPNDTSLLQSISFDNPDDLRKNQGTLNEIFKKMSLLIRVSTLGKPYYLIPAHLVSNSITHIKSKVDEITKIITFHRKKYYKEYSNIGLVMQQDDLILHEISFRFREHRFVVIDSIEKSRTITQSLDMVILTKDIFEIILMEKISTISQEMVTKKRLYQYSVYLLWKIFRMLKPDGEVFVISNCYTPKTNQITKVTFKTIQEEKNFLLFTHIFKTRKRYKLKDRSAKINVFDFQKYLSGVYVEQEVIDELLGGKDLDDMTLKQLNNLPYINFQLTDWSLLSDQERTWSNLFSIYLDKIFLKPLVPRAVKEDWRKRFSCADYTPEYMKIYLGQKKPLKITLAKIMNDVDKSGLAGCPIALLADYRDSFEYVIKTLRVIEGLKKGAYHDLPQLYLDRLRQPLENKSKRFSSLEDVIKLIGKIRRLEKISSYLNPDNIESPLTKVIKNLEFLTFFGFSYNELKEIVYIIMGHSTLERIISGKINEMALKPLSDLARNYSPEKAINLLRYCLLMTTAETEASRSAELTPGQLAELFDLYALIIRVVTNRELDWDSILDEKISAMGGIHNKIIRKILMMMNYHEFLDTWPDLEQKGEMEKEALADYNEQQLLRIENVIKLVKTIDRFEEIYLKSDPLQISVFYRKLLKIEFHGTGRLFERMDSRHVVILLWMAVNLAQGGAINFNPILSDIEAGQIDEYMRKIEHEALAINTDYLYLDFLRQFQGQLYRHGKSFIIGTGFQFRTSSFNQVLELTYMDMDKNIDLLDVLSKKLAGCFISEINTEDLKKVESLFSNLESFYQGHLRLLKHTDSRIKLPARQKLWFIKIQDLREFLRSNLLNVIFRPEDVYTDLDLLFRHTPAILNFILPEFTALRNIDLSFHLYMKLPVTHYIMASVRKLQALIRRNKENFQDTQYLHRLAQKEFGPMATGIVGVSESQINELENIVESLRGDRSMFDALIKAFIFQDIGRVPSFREKYKDDINPADFAQAGAIFLEKEKIAENYQLDKKGKTCLSFFVMHHSLLHHIVRGEISFFAIKDILDPRDKKLFDAFFLFSLIMLSAIREDLILEDLADRLFRIRKMCHKIINKDVDFEEQMNKVFILRGELFYALEEYEKKGLPRGDTALDLLKGMDWEKPEKLKLVRAGKMIFAMERFFRMLGIRYVEFYDLVCYKLKVSMKTIYNKRKFAGIGYSTFERELFETYSTYMTFQVLPETIRHFILDYLLNDKIRFFWYEKVSMYLSNENRIKLLLLGIMGAEKIRTTNAPVCIAFFRISEQIEKRHEVVNDYLSSLSFEKIRGSKSHLNHFFKASAGILFKQTGFPNFLSIDFRYHIDISRQIKHMGRIDNVEQLKRYYYQKLRSLRKEIFQTDDYEVQLERAFEKRLVEITDMILNRTKKEMDLISDFKNLHKLVEDLLERSWDIGLSDDQRHRLNDLYELRKDRLKREKLTEINDNLKTFHNVNGLKKYWDSIKWDLQKNRRFFGKEFETLIARKFDKVKKEIEDVVLYG